MPEWWFDLSPADQSDALELAAGQSGRPAHLLEKDIWVVWTLSVLYEAPFASHLTFKGGTSLSKAYQVIDRFSEDVDLTYDIRQLVPDLLRDGDPIPTTRSQINKVSREIRHRLSDWINSEIRPCITTALQERGVSAELTPDADVRDALRLTYPPLKTGTGYASNSVLLEFGARATGKPHAAHAVGCDIASHIAGVTFPSANPLVMAAERTFWEKATAIHAFCKQGRLRSDRLARHWYDIAALAGTTYAEAAINDRELARDVARHKSAFFPERDTDGAVIDYRKAVNGALQLVPSKGALTDLEKDYRAMVTDGLLLGGQVDFADVLGSCAHLQERINSSVAR